MSCVEIHDLTGIGFGVRHNEKAPTTSNYGIAKGHQMQETGNIKALHHSQILNNDGNKLSGMVVIGKTTKSMQTNEKSLSQQPVPFENTNKKVSQSLLFGMKPVGEDVLKLKPVVDEEDVYAWCLKSAVLPKVEAWKMTFVGHLLGK